MGTWGLENFENDNALDFVADIIKGNKKLIKSAVEKILAVGDSEYLEAPDCDEALVAIEFVAAAKGNPSDNFPEDAALWLKNNDVLKYNSGLFSKKIDVVEMSQKAIQRIITNSELKELWEESDEFDDWMKIQNNLLLRLK